MAIKIEEINYIAKLAKLSFTKEEAEKFSSEFEDILNYFSLLEKYDFADTPLYSFDQNQGSILRRDTAHDFEDKEKLFKNVKKMRNDYIEVPKIIE